MVGLVAGSLGGSVSQTCFERVTFHSVNRHNPQQQLLGAVVNNQHWMVIVTSVDRC